MRPFYVLRVTSMLVAIQDDYLTVCSVLPPISAIVDELMLSRDTLRRQDLLICRTSRTSLTRLFHHFTH